ncbi:restriction endonuclease subunit S [Stieleria bergensis]|uniref:restriction endonuclease subunit S n=1 Tax=Stieleria bergensis TaxID=2528025 RepID=UPI003AF3B823
MVAQLAARRRERAASGQVRNVKLPPLTEKDLDGSVSKHWRWERLGNLIELMDSGWSPACEPVPTVDETEWGVLKTTAVQSFRFHPEEHKRLPSGLVPRPEAEAKVGDLLITRAGPQNRVGISCLIKSVRPRLMISDKIIRFHLLEGFLFDEFVALCLNAGVSQDHIERSKSGMAASQMNVSQSKLRLTPIPIPPLAEQKRIVAKVDRLLAQCDRVAAGLRDRQSTTEQLLTASIHRILADQD